jgi:hypothetical protein
MAATGKAVIPPTSTEQILEIQTLENCVFHQLEKIANIDLIMSLRDQFLDQHDFLSWSIADAIASVATGQWIWSPSGVWRHWEPPHRWLGASKPQVKG